MNAELRTPCARTQLKPVPLAPLRSARARILAVTECWAVHAGHPAPPTIGFQGCQTHSALASLLAVHVGGELTERCRAELTTITRILLRRRCICEGGLWQELLVSHPAVRFSSAASVFSVPPPKLGSCSRDLMRLKMPHYFARTSIQTTLPPSSRQLAQSERRQRTCSDELLECKDHTCSTCSMVPFIGHPEDNPHIASKSILQTALAARLH